MEDKIAELRRTLIAYGQAWSNNDISDAEYHKANQAISKQISKLRENQPSNFYSPEAQPGHFADPFLKLHKKLKDQYNAARAEIRAGGIYDASGCRVKFVEKELNAIYARALSKVANARNIQTLQHIESDTAKEVTDAMPFEKAA